MKGAVAANQDVMEVKTKVLGFFAIVAAFATVLMFLTLGGGTAQAVTCSEPSLAWQSWGSLHSDWRRWRGPKAQMASQCIASAL